MVSSSLYIFPAPPKLHRVPLLPAVTAVRIVTGHNDLNRGAKPGVDGWKHGFAVPIMKLPWTEPEPHSGYTTITPSLETHLRHRPAHLVGRLAGGPWPVDLERVLGEQLQGHLCELNRKLKVLVYGRNFHAS